VIKVVYEDFDTDYAPNEVDPNNNIDYPSDYHIDHLNKRSEIAYVFVDKGENHFGDWTHDIDIRSDYLQNYSIGIPWVLSNDLGDIKGLRTASKTYLHIRMTRIDSAYWIRLLETNLGTEYPSDWTGGAQNTWYYLRIVKSGTSLVCGIYSTHALRIAGDGTDGDLANLSLTLHADHSFRYIFACNTFYDGNTYSQNVDIENFDLHEAVVTMSPSIVSLVIMDMI